MNKQKIYEHMASVVAAVLTAEERVKPTLSERIEANKLIEGELTAEDRMAIVDQYILDIAKELVDSCPEEEVEKLYKEL